MSQHTGRRRAGTTQGGRVGTAQAQRQVNLVGLGGGGTSAAYHIEFSGELIEGLNLGANDVIVSDTAAEGDAEGGTDTWIGTGDVTVEVTGFDPGDDDVQGELEVVVDGQSFGVLGEGDATTVPVDGGNGDDGTNGGNGDQPPANGDDGGIGGTGITRDQAFIVSSAIAGAGAIVWTTR